MTTENAESFLARIAAVAGDEAQTAAARGRLLAQLAMDARDADDYDAFPAAQAAYTALPWQSHPDGQATPRPRRITFGIEFRQMYPDRIQELDAPRILLLKEKHETRHINAQGPDGLARAALSVVQQRLADGYWYLDDLREISGEESVVFRGYLDTLRNSEAIRGADAERRDQLKEWMSSPTMAELRANVSATEIARRIAREVRAGGPQDDLFLAFLSLAAIGRESMWRYEVAELLVNAAAGPMTRRVGETCAPRDASRARGIIREATVSLRRAGRQALAFLTERSVHEYEGVEVRAIEEPTFRVDPAPLPGAG